MVTPPYLERADPIDAESNGARPERAPRTYGESKGREWRQLQLLARDSVRRLLNAAVLSRDGDPWQFAIWATALVQTPPTLYAISVSAKYLLLRSAPAAVVERVLLADRMFFVVYAMTAAALLTSLTWEALFPDRTDQEIVGALPVRPRTLALARLAAAILMAATFATAITLPSAVFFSFFSITRPPLWHIVFAMTGHLLATVGGALSMFFLLLLVRGVAAILLTARAANVLAAVLQVASVSGLIEVFLYVPSILPRMVDAMVAGQQNALMLPPVWFAALYGVVAGGMRVSMWAEAVRGVVVIAALLLLVGAVYLAPAAWMARRALESSSKQNARFVSSITRAAGELVAWPPGIQPIVVFLLASFTRSRRHVLVVMTQLAIGLAIAAVSVIAATVRHTLDLHGPTASLLAVPLVLMFFAALGLRAAFAIPIDFEANWPFRLAPTGVMQAALATRVGMIALAVLPLASLACVTALALGWSAGTAVPLGVLEGLAGALLVECVTYGWHEVPFAHERVLSNQSLSWRGLIMAVPLFFFAFVDARAQMAALVSPRAAAWYVATVVALALTVHHFSARESMRHALAFDDDGDASLAVLNLSNAL